MKLKNYFEYTDVCIACRDHKIPRTKFSQFHETHVALLQQRMRFQSRKK